MLKIIHAHSSTYVRQTHKDTKADNLLNNINRREIQSMECPECKQELDEHDYYGLGIPGRADFKKTGDIFKCGNEECGSYQDSFYTKNNDGDLYEGYPC